MDIPDVDRRIHAAIAHLYEAALKPDEWSVALDDMAALCGGMGITVFPLKAVSNGFTYVSGSVAEAAGVYFSEWLERCPRIAYDARNPIGDRCFWDGDILDENTLRRDPYFHEYAARHDLQYSVIRATTALAGGVKHVISTPYSLQTGKPDDWKMQLFALLSDHAVRAMAIHERLGAAQASKSAMSRLLDNRNCGTILLNGSGYVAEMNELACLLTQDGLLIVNHRLQSASPTQQQALNRMLAAALAGDAARPQEPLALKRGHGRLPLLVQAMPLARYVDSRLRDHGFGLGGVLVTVTEPEIAAGGTLEQAFRMLGLTQGEARVADLLAGGTSPQTVADMLALSTGTVRNHLKNIFAKLEITRQSELVALAGRLTGLRSRT